MTEGKDRKQQRQSEIETKKKEIEQVKVELEEKRALKETVEAPEKEALDKIKAEEDRLKQLREEEEKHLREQEALVWKTYPFTLREKLLHPCQSYNN